MNLARTGLLVCCMFFTSGLALSSPCGKDGMKALRADDGGGFLFYVFREGPDIYFAIGGQKISFPQGTDGPRRFVVDGILYESLLVEPAEFMKVEKDTADLDILKRQQKYDFDFMQKSATVLRQPVELGPRVKPAADGQPNFTFYLWKAVDPHDSKGARQYFLTTVSAGEVVVLTAIVPNEAAEETAMQAFETYAGSFQHVLRKEQCPEQTANTAVPSQWKENGQAVADTAEHKSVNGFGGQLLVVKDPQAFINEWLKPETPHIDVATNVKRGEIYGAFILFAGCRPDAKGICNAEVDYMLYKPDGSLYDERKGQPLWKEPAPPTANTQLSSAILGFRIETNDPSGEYTVKARVSDLNARISFDLETKFRVK